MVEQYAADDLGTIRPLDTIFESNESNGKARNCVRTLEDGHIHFAGSDGANDDRSGDQSRRMDNYDSYLRSVSKPIGLKALDRLERRMILVSRRIDDSLNRIAVALEQLEDSRSSEKLSIEILTDWAGKELSFRPYVVSLE